MKIRNICIYIIFLVTIFSLFKLPEILLSAEEKKYEEMTYVKNQRQSKIDVEAEKIYLVKVIHIMDKNKVTEIKYNYSNREYESLVEIQDSNKLIDVQEQISKLADYNILNNVEFKENVTQAIGFLFKMYKDDENTYIINNVILESNQKEYKAEIENKTNKILYLYFDKDELNNQIGKKEILENYIKYLDLYIIDDWKYEEDVENKIYSLKSEKTDLRVNLMDTGDNKYIISIHTSSLYY